MKKEVKIKNERDREHVLDGFPHEGFHTTRGPCEADRSGFRSGGVNLCY